VPGKRSDKRRGIYKRGGLYWLRTDPVEGTPKSTRSKTLEGAREFLAERERLASNPAYTAAHQTTLGVWVSRMLANKEQGRAPATALFYRQKAGHLLRLIGATTPLARINSMVVEDYKNRRFAERAHHYTISKEFNALRQTLKMASYAGQYPFNIQQLFPLEFGLGYTPRDTVLPREQEAILKLACTPTQWAHVAFILGSSARYSELFAAQPSDYDRDTKTLRLRGTKTEGSDRVIPVIGSLRHYIVEAFEHLPFGWRAITSQLPAICKRAGIARLTPNDLRRTCATRLVEDGVNPYDVIKLTGHVDTKMLKRVYDRSKVESVGAAIEQQIQASKQARKP
jgi:integrase